MGALEQIAVSDLKLRAVIGGAAVTFSAIFAGFSFGLQSATGMALGVVIGIIASFAAGYILLQLVA